MAQELFASAVDVINASTKFKGGQKALEIDPQKFIDDLFLPEMLNKIDETSQVTFVMKKTNDMALAKKLIRSPVPSSAAYLLEIVSNQS